MAATKDVRSSNGMDAKWCVYDITNDEYVPVEVMEKRALDRKEADRRKNEAVFKALGEQAEEMTTAEAPRLARSVSAEKAAQSSKDSGADVLYGGEAFDINHDEEPNPVEYGERPRYNNVGVTFDDIDRKIDNIGHVVQFMRNCNVVCDPEQAESIMKRLREISDLIRPLGFL